jgi:hypothetical protein
VAKLSDLSQWLNLVVKLSDFSQWLNLVAKISDLNQWLNLLKITWKQARNETFKVDEMEQLY